MGRIKAITAKTRQENSYFVIAIGGTAVVTQAAER
jgi:hypothetical protein